VYAKNIDACVDCAWCVLYNMCVWRVVKVGLRGTDGMRAQAWVGGEGNVSGMGGGKGCQSAKQGSTRREREKENNGHDRQRGKKKESPSAS
jgi:hypothetical protein